MFWHVNKDDIVSELQLLAAHRRSLEFGCLNHVRVKLPDVRFGFASYCLNRPAWTLSGMAKAGRKQTGCFGRSHARADQ
jgi:hypothetical protein